MRTLTPDEQVVLAHVVADPAAWWAHCQTNYDGDPGEALAAKVAKNQPSYDAEKDLPGYKNRAERDAPPPAPPLPDWEQLMAAHEISDLLEDIIDAMDAPMKARLSPETRAKHTAKKTLRGNRP